MNVSIVHSNETRELLRSPHVTVLSHLCLRCEAKHISPTTPSSQVDDLLSGRRRCSFIKYRGRLWPGSASKPLPAGQNLVPRVGMYGSNAVMRGGRKCEFGWANRAPLSGCDFTHAGQRASEKLAVNSVEDECHHDRTPLFDRGPLVAGIRFRPTSRRKGNGFVAAWDQFYFFGCERPINQPNNGVLFREFGPMPWTIV